MHIMQYILDEEQIQKKKLKQNFLHIISIISVDKKMDYPKLYSELPKQPIKWTVNDIQIWLQFIGLSSLYDKFKELSIDGSCLSSLTEEDLRSELNIKSGITIKKITSWITKGLKEYQEFLKSPMAGASEIDYEQIQQITQKSKNRVNLPFIQQSKPINKHASIKSVPGESGKKPPAIMQRVSSCGDTNKECQQVQDEQEEKKRKQYELIIQQYDGLQNSFYSVRQDGAKVGRHSTNQILILDESISRFHAQIKFNDGKFFIQDSGSTTGTFIKIMQKMLIVPEMIIQMGSNQFQSHYFDGILTLEIIEGPSQGYIIEIPKNNTVSIGRKQTNMLNFPDDQHLSNIHATIFTVDNKYYIQDMGTTNGSWLRLSLQGETSTFYQLTDKLVFKFGSNQTYSCKIKTQMVSERTNTNACIICYQNDKDCVYMPCKHNTACIRCSKNLRDCPICRNKIEDYVRIYKS